MVYESGKMPNKRKDGKKLVTFWATQEEKEALLDAMKESGFETMTDYLRWLANNPPIVEGEEEEEISLEEK